MTLILNISISFKIIKFNQSNIHYSVNHQFLPIMSPAPSDSSPSSFFSPLKRI